MQTFAPVSMDVAKLTIKENNNCLLLFKIDLIAIFHLEDLRKRVDSKLKVSIRKKVFLH